jgi:hypothetical protein
MAMQLQQDPAAMAEMMASPMMQGFMNSVMQNPEMLRAMIDSNPGMRQVLDAHPELRHALADPETLRQSLAVLQNPELLREQMRRAQREQGGEGGDVDESQHRNRTRFFTRANQGTRRLDSRDRGTVSGRCDPGPNYSLQRQNYCHVTVTHC